MSKKTSEDQPIDIQESISKTEEFLRHNQKSLSIIGTAILVIIGGYIAYQQFWVKPQEESANLAHYYAGTAYLRLGEYDKAIEYLKKYDAEDDITGATALGCIGDAYLEKENLDEALRYYRKAYEWDENQFTACIYMMKAALVYELKNDWKQALALYERIKNDYPNSTEARDVEKYISRARTMANA